MSEHSSKSRKRKVQPINDAELKRMQCYVYWKINPFVDSAFDFMEPFLLRSHTLTEFCALLYTALKAPGSLYASVAALSARLALEITTMADAEDRVFASSVQFWTDFGQIEHDLALLLDSVPQLSLVEASILSPGTKKTKVDNDLAAGPSPRSVACPGVPEASTKFGE